MLWAGDLGVEVFRTNRNTITSHSMSPKAVREHRPSAQYSTVSLVHRPPSIVRQSMRQTSDCHTAAPECKPAQGIMTPATRLTPALPQHSLQILKKLASANSDSP